MSADSSLELVVARYNEELNWLRRVPSNVKVSIYDKHPDTPHPNSVALPNIGREADTYLQHILRRYNSLADLTVFCQGRPFDHAYDFHATLRDLATQGTTQDFLPLGHIVDTDDARGLTLFVGWSKNENGRQLDMTGFHRALFDSDGPSEYTFRPGAQFAATAELIRSRPREFYQRALHVAQQFPDAAHCFERSWPLIFGLQNPDAAWLQGRKTAYLKPLKKLKPG